MHACIHARNHACMDPGMHDGMHTWRLWPYLVPRSPLSNITLHKLVFKVRWFERLGVPIISVAEMMDVLGGLGLAGFPTERSEACSEQSGEAETFSKQTHDA